MRDLLPATRWRLLASPNAGAAANMAVDHALLEHAARTGEGVLRTYGWAPRALSLGRNQRGAGVFAPARAAELGIDVVRRPTGGRAILHAREHTFSLAAPIAAAASVARVAAVTAAWLRAALGALGADVEVAAVRRRHAPPGATACFAEPARGELTWRGRKLAGVAQWRDGGALLQQGSVLVDDDQPLLGALSLVPLSGMPPAATLRETIGREPGQAEFTRALADALAQLVGDALVPLAPLDPAAQPGAALARLYRDDAWTWRR
ncbi:MAG: hypothetical protein HYX65_11180 [Gemmatimonadetes bacterium]|nr:hypothetical protein [Gemmatimonadota bacterium]